jgi:hypothetical protein
MTTSLTPGGQQRGNQSLSAEAHQEVMELLRLADKSKIPEIRAAAIKIARERGKTPTGIVASFTGIVFVAAAACWYSLLHYPQRLAMEIDTVIIACLFILFGSYALLTGHLSQANFMQIIEWVWEHFKNPKSGPPQQE